MHYSIVMTTPSKATRQLSAVSPLRKSPSLSWFRPAAIDSRSINNTHGSNGIFGPDSDYGNQLDNRSIYEEVAADTAPLSQQRFDIFISSHLHDTSCDQFPLCLALRLTRNSNLRVALPSHQYTISLTYAELHGSTSDIKTAACSVPPPVSDSRSLDLLSRSQQLLFVLSNHCFSNGNQLQELRLAMKLRLPITFITYHGARWLGVHEFPPFSLVPLDVQDAFNTKAIDHNRMYFEEFMEKVVKRIRGYQNKVVPIDAEQRDKVVSSSPAAAAVQLSPAAPLATTDAIQPTRPLRDIDVFLSHKRTDTADFCRSLHSDLALTEKYSVFLDQNSDSELSSLLDTVRRTRTLLFVLSDHILDSMWCLAEIRAAIAAGTEILFVVYEGAKWKSNNAGNNIATESPTRSCWHCQDQKTGVEPISSPVMPLRTASPSDLPPSHLFPSDLRPLFESHRDSHRILCYQRNYHAAFIRQVVQRVGFPGKLQTEIWPGFAKKLSNEGAADPKASLTRSERDAILNEIQPLDKFLQWAGGEGEGATNSCSIKAQHECVRFMMDHAEYVSHIAEYFPSLQSIKIEQNPLLPMNEITLPPKLQSLDLRIDCDIRSFSFPPTLLELTFGSRFNQPMIGVQLPPNLRTLTFGSSFNQPVAVSEEEQLQLPPTIIVIEFADAFNQDVTHWRLPDSITTIRFGEDFNHCLDHVKWPASLTRLDIGEFWDQYSRYRHPLDAVERALPHLQMKKFVD